MEHGHNTTYIRYTLSSASQPIQLTLLPLCTYRNFHTERRSADNWSWRVGIDKNTITLSAQDDATPYYLLAPSVANFVPLDLWYLHFSHRGERERGLDCVEDLYLPGLWRIELKPGQTITVVATTENTLTFNGDGEAALQRERARQASLVVNATDDVERHLFLAADQFIVQRQVEGQTLTTILAGYPWFSDWGRDTMIALEGLTLVTARFAEAKKILLAFAQYVDRGMLPNRFPDAGGDAAPVDYNTVDATLWYFHAIDRYLDAAQDDTLLHELFPILESIIDWHLRGTRYNIRVDPADGLLYAGEIGVALTWMDAQIGEWVVTPRIGKPVEINALWYRALRLMEGWAEQVGKSSKQYTDWAERARVSFQKFWYAEGNYLYDVIDAPTIGNDASLRPNQIFAISLTGDLLTREQARAVLQIVRQNLLTPFGLRSLSPHDAHYRALYRGNREMRDSAYHQGVVWSWLIGAYIDAYLQVYADRDAARQALVAFPPHLMDAGIGTISEIFEADPPFRPVGCIAQAWSVAEVLRHLRQMYA
jgi:predicted glycogen debranching enzyme